MAKIILRCLTFAFLVMASAVCARGADAGDAIIVSSGAILSGDGDLFASKTFDGMTLGLAPVPGTVFWFHEPVDAVTRHILSFEAKTSGCAFFLELKNTEGEVIHETPALLVELPNSGGILKRFSLDLGPAIATSNGAAEIIVIYGPSAAISLRNITYSEFSPINTALLQYDYRRYTLSRGAWAMPAPFLDLLPGLNFVSTPFAGFQQDHSLRAFDAGSTSATLPRRLKGTSISIKLNDSPYFGMIYSSSMQFVLDVEFKNQLAGGIEKVLVQNVTNNGVAKLRMTLPRSGGLPALISLDLRDSLIAGLDDYSLHTITFSDPSPSPSDIEIMALGFATNRPPETSSLGIAQFESSAHVFYYNGCLEVADDLSRSWRLIPEARNDFISAASQLGFFKTRNFSLPAVPQGLVSISGGSSIGYINITIKPGFNFIANPLRSGKNMLREVIQQTLPENLVFLKAREPCTFQDPRGDGVLSEFVRTFGIASADVSVNVRSGGTWTNPDQTFAPGEGAVMYNPSTQFVLTVVGAVLQGNLMNFVPSGLSLSSSIVPQTGSLSKNLLFKPSMGDSVSVFDGSVLQTFTFTVDQSWSPSEPVVSYGQSFLINAHSAFVWSRDFRIP